MGAALPDEAITLRGFGAAIDSPQVEALVDRLAREDIIGQLLARQGRMRELATEDGDVKLDWVDGVERALAQPEWLAAVEEEAAAIVRRGVRHVIWSGMGGSVQTLHALKRMGYLNGPTLTIHPLDGTDPASLNRVLYEMAAIEQVPLPGAVARGDRWEIRERLRVLLDATMMIGVSMGMTSEEPITHLEWFDALLNEVEVADPGSHIQVMTLPGSYLDQFARTHGAVTVPIQLDGQNRTPGRMSAPATRVFLRPIALMLVAAAVRGALVGDGARPRAGSDVPAFTGDLLRPLLRRGQQLYGVSHDLTREQRAALTRTDVFVRLGAYLSDAARGEARNKVVLVLPRAWRGLGAWLEQLVEESLGKGGKGVLIFYDQDIGSPAAKRDDVVVLQARARGDTDELAMANLRQQNRPVLTLEVPVADAPRLERGLGEVAALFLNLKKTVAVFGYLEDIVFAGQPAVEAYKRYARRLRQAPGPVRWPENSPHRASFRSLTLYYSSPVTLGFVSPEKLQAEAQRLGDNSANAAAIYAALLSLARQGKAHGVALPEGAGGGRGPGKGRSRRSFSKRSAPAEGPAPTPNALGPTPTAWFRYHDITWNGEPTPAVEAVLAEAQRGLVNNALGMPSKLRTGPRDYHSTEQSEVDGPDELISLRLVALSHEPVLAGTYTDKFLLAQARGTWQAMEDARRWVVMGTLPDATADSLRDLADFFGEVRRLLTRLPTSADLHQPPDPGVAAAGR